MADLYLSNVAFFLVLVLLAHSFQILLNRMSDRAHRHKGVGRPMREFTNPRSTKLKLPVFLSIFMFLGIIEAWMIYVIEIDPELAGMMGGLMVVGTYMLMWSVLGRHNETLYMLIIMGGIFLSVIVYFASAYAFTGGEIDLWPIRV